MPYLRNSIAYDHDFCYTRVKLWYLPAFFPFFWNCNFLGCYLGKRAKDCKIIKSNNYICHVSYLMNRKACDHDFWYTCVKWWYVQEFFLIFWNFHFWAVRGVKGKSIAQNENKNYIRHEPYLRNSITNDHDFCYTCVKWWYLQLLFFLFFLLL